MRSIPFGWVWCVIARSLHAECCWNGVCASVMIMNERRRLTMQAATSKPSTDQHFIWAYFSFSDFVLDVAILPSDTIAHCNALYFNLVLVSVWIVFCNVSACAAKSVNWRAPDPQTQYAIAMKPIAFQFQFQLTNGIWMLLLLLLIEMINRQMHAYNAHGRLRTPMRKIMNIIIKFEISNANEQQQQHPTT